MKEIDKLRKQIQKIKMEISKIDDIRPGTLSEQYNVCGKPNCRCKKTPPQKHGPYLQLAYTRRNKSTTRFIKKEHVEDIQQQVRNYNHLKELIDSWIDLAINLSDIKIKSGIG